MKIRFSESGGKPKKIVIPNFLFLSPPSLAILTSYINKEAKKNGGDRIKYSWLAAITKAVKNAKRTLATNGLSSTSYPQTASVSRSFYNGALL